MIIQELSFIKTTFCRKFQQIRKQIIITNKQTKENRSTLIQRPFHHKFTLVPLKQIISQLSLCITNLMFPVKHHLMYLESNIRSL